MVKFVCKNCGFRLDRDKVEKCPYCDGKSLEKEKSATELLDSVDEQN